MVGQIPTNNPLSYGGATVLTKQMLDYFNENQKKHIFIKSNKFEGKFSFIINYIYIIFSLLIHIRKIDIIFMNVTKNGALYVTPVALFFAKIFKKKLVFRMFGGNFDRYYKNGPKLIQRLLIDYVIKNSNILFFETKYSVEYFLKINPNTYWFPNVRKRPLSQRTSDREYKKRFIFLGHIRHEKGIDEILEASTMLDDNFSIELYGTIRDKKYNELLWEKFPKVKYKGELEPEKVYDKLLENDVLLLPSYREGYPGVLIEAFGVGLPVIVTNLRGINEMLDGKECGVLIEPKDAGQLAEAMKYIDNNNYQKMSSLALESFNNFEYESTYTRVLKICEESIV